MNNKKTIYILLLIMPILDLITSLTTRFNLTSFSIGVIVKTLFLVFVIYYLLFKSTSKHKKVSITYLSLIFLYLIMYFITKIKYLTISSFITESTYMIKLYFYPILLATLYCYFDDKKISKQELIKVLIINLITYVILLIIPLITKTSFQTYSYGLSGVTGWYYAANEISIILILLFPFIYLVIKKQNILWLLLPIITVITISTIGTKASMIGLIIDSILVFILSLFYKKNKKMHKKTIIVSFLLLMFITTIFSSSNSLTNFKVTLGIQQSQNITTNMQRKQERKLIREEINKLDKQEKENNKKDDKNDDNKKDDNKKENENKIEKFLNTYGRALLSDRDLYVDVTYKIYKNNYNTNTLLYGIGFTNNLKYKTFAIEKLIEIDPLDIYFHAGFIALILILLPFIYYIYYLFKNKKININITFYTLMLGMILCISCISGHTFLAPAVSIYVVIYFILAYNELNLISKKNKTIEKNKITIYALHLNYGGVEKNICTKANMLSKIYNVEIISLYHLTEKPVFELNDKVKVKYLTNKKIIPNKEKFLKASKEKNIIKVLKEGLYSIKVLYLKNTLITKSMIECNSEIIISTRIDFTKKLIKNNEIKNIKIAEEHIYHNNNDKYLNSLYKILKHVDYLMPSSNYLTDYYKKTFPEYAYKIKTNKMPIETDGSISNLKNKTIISVGRLSPEKGYRDLINIYNNLNKKDWELIIVGDGSEYENLNKQIKSLNLENNIKLVGTKNTKELNKLYKRASIYIMASYEESFGLVLLEAASHGLPIIAYSTALGAKEILKDQFGILIDNRDELEMTKALTNLIDDPKLRKTYQKKSLKITEAYNYETIEQENIEFYKNIKKTHIFSTLYKASKKTCYELIKNKLKKQEKTFIITANPETYMLSEKDIEMNNIIYNKNNLIVPDGIAVVKIARFLGVKIQERITGVDLAEYLLELANLNKYKVYLFGASEDVIEKLENVIKQNYPNIKLVGASNGYINDKDGVMNYIKTTKPDIIMVALGIPMQEMLINRHINDFDKGIFIGVGGSFDVISGTKKRAPKIFIDSNSEWLYRIAKEPKRIPRFIKYNIKFLIKMLKNK